MMAMDLWDRFNVGLLTAFTALFSAARALAAEEETVSPLATVMAGRDEAKNSLLSEDGITDLTSSGANILLYVCGAAGIALAAYGIYTIWDSQRMADQRFKTAGSGVIMIVCGGLLTIPAIMAAVVPHAVLGAE